MDEEQARVASIGPPLVRLDGSGEHVEASLPHLPFDDDSFDAVTANFVINHVGDPRAAMRDLARVARPGGRVANGPRRGPRWSPVPSARRASFRSPVDTYAPELDFDRSVDGLRALAEAAGRGAMTATELSWDWDISVDALWDGIAGGVATVGQTFLAQVPDVRVSAERAFREAFADLACERILRLSSTAAYVVAA